ncbi:hypothetical protein [Tomitella biformata]|uniref:hypothetical protein n=1 Tax=Tomitella biformata TaxID=630403 RepID=UPI000465C7AC|nr:hypothetical protein [Tomitella biformata]
MRHELAGHPKAGGLKDRAPLGRFEIFLFTAVATVLITRAYLAATGFPQVGGGNLHVAHVLWGGLLLGIAIVLMVIVPGGRAKTRGAFLGGIGFGLFIDEVGKFLTKNVDYFFEPAIAVMYVVFVAFYLVVVVLLRRRGITDRLRLTTGLDALTDETLGQLTQARRALVLVLLDEISDPDLTGVAAEVAAALRVETSVDRGFEHRLTQWRDATNRGIGRLLARRITRRIVIGFFILEAALVALSVVVALATEEVVTIVGVAELGAVLSGIVITVMVFIGVGFLIRDKYLTALRILRAAIVVDLLVNEVFNFATQQFGALLGFGLALVMLAVLRIAIRELELTEEQAAVASGPTEADPVEAL